MEVRPLGRSLLRGTEGHKVKGKQHGSGQLPSDLTTIKYSVTTYSIGQ